MPKNKFNIWQPDQISGRIQNIRLMLGQISSKYEYYAIYLVGYEIDKCRFPSPFNLFQTKTQYFSPFPLIPKIQEPGTAAEIKQFAANYNVKFDMMEKVDVNGKNAHPVWVYLKAKQGGLLGMFPIRHCYIKQLCFCLGLSYSPLPITFNVPPRRKDPFFLSICLIFSPCIPH